MTRSIEQILSGSRTAISNAIAGESIQAALTPFGYTPEKLQQGMRLLEDAENKYTRQIDEYGDKAGASQAAQQARDTLNDFYIPHVLIARIAFKKNIRAYQSLELSGKRKKSIAASIAQARTFYTNANGEASYKAALLPFGINDAKLTRGLALVNAAIAALNTAKEEAAQAQEATELRDQALDTLEEWTSDFITIARIALADHPQKLEALGVVVKRD